MDETHEPAGASDPPNSAPAGSFFLRQRLLVIRDRPGVFGRTTEPDDFQHRPAPLDLNKGVPFPAKLARVAHVPLSLESELDLCDDRDDHRAPLDPLVDEAGNSVVKVGLDQVQILDPGLGRVGQRVFDEVGYLVEQS